MKQLKDIHTSKNPTVSIDDPLSHIETHVEKPFQDGLYDISRVEDPTIILHEPQEIVVTKKRGKNFDALEVSRGLLAKRKIDPIRLTKKKRFSITPYRLRFQRYLKGLSLAQYAMFFGIFIFAVIVLGFIDKQIIENRVNNGYQDLIDIKQGNLGLSEIQKKINSARFDLLVSDVLFTPFLIIPDEKIQSVGHVISGGRYLTRSLDDILALYTTVEQFIQDKPLHQIYFTQLFSNISSNLQTIETTLQKSVSKYQAITWLPNNSLQEVLKSNVENLEYLLSYLTSLNTHFDTFLNIFGHSEKKRYLIVFQNADEIRPTGGFMGSMGLLEIFRGRVQLFQQKDVYAIEWDLKKANYERLPAPKGIDTLTDTFGLRDANYYVNLKDSSEAIKFFTDNSGINVDGIIYLNQNVLLRLLEITGPVYFPELGIDIDSDNFSAVMSVMVESKEFKEGTLGTPKQILFDFMQVFQQKLISEGKYFDYAQSIIKDVEDRDLMMWSFDSEENAFLAELGANGTPKYDETLDYSYPVFTSISGNKSDRYMYRKFRQSVTSGSQCQYEVHFEIQSTHNMSKNDREFLETLIQENNLTTENLLEIQGAGANKQFVRVILPEGAILKPQDGVVEVDYGVRKGAEFFITTEPQETTFFEIQYLLLNRACQPYTYKFFKQSGIPSYDITMDIDGDIHSYTGETGDFYFEKRDK